MKQAERFIELDILRGIAIVSMIIFHFFFLLWYLGFLDIQTHQGWWLVFARFIQFTFLGLVGVCLAISYQKAEQKHKRESFYTRQIKRAVIVLASALLVTLATAFMAPQYYIRFGVLHFIGTSIILALPIVSRPKLCLVLAPLIYAASFWVHATKVSLVWLLILGFDYHFASLDHFPIFPWFSMICIGISLGHLLYNGASRSFPFPESIKNSFLKKLSLSGQHSLVIYLLHIPILLFIIKGWQWMGLL